MSKRLNAVELIDFELSDTTVVVEKFITWCCAYQHVKKMISVSTTETDRTVGRFVTSIDVSAGYTYIIYVLKENSKILIDEYVIQTRLSKK